MCNMVNRVADLQLVKIYPDRMDKIIIAKSFLANFIYVFFELKVFSKNRQLITKISEINKLVLTNFTGLVN